MENKRYIFIVNPFSGSGKSLHAANTIKKYCTENKLDYEIIYTTRAGEATHIAREYSDSIIFAVGGDGTVNEVLNGVVGTNNMLGIIPVGSGNDFYKSLSQIEEEYPCVDIGKINDNYFINVACIGIDSEIALNAELIKTKRIPASQKYNVSILYTFLKFKFKELEFKYNQLTNRGKYTIVTVCNGQYYGGGYRMAPNASMMDNVFDVYFADQLKKWQMPGLILKLKLGTHETSANIHKIQTDLIEINSQEDIICNIDGETLISKSFQIELLKNAITLFNDRKMIENFLK